MTTEEARNLRLTLQRELDQIAGRVGFKLQLGACTYGEAAVFKLECVPVKADGTAPGLTELYFRRNADLYGLTPEHYGREFVTGGRRFVLAGAKPRNTKFPLIARRDDGKMFKFPAATVRAAMGGAK